MMADRWDTPEEKEYCDCVRLNRMNLYRFLEDFTTAVRLFELLERGGNPQNGVFGGDFIHYRMIAAKEGALNVYHFGKSLHALTKITFLCPTSRNTTNFPLLKHSWRSFNKYFPHWENTRHAVAHAGELWESPAKAREHAEKENRVSASGDSGVSSHTLAKLFNRKYSVGWKGQLFEVNMDEPTIQKLTVILKLVELA